MLCFLLILYFCHLHFIFKHIVFIKLFEFLSKTFNFRKRNECKHTQNISISLLYFIYNRNNAHKTNKNNDIFEAINKIEMECKQMQ